MTLDIQTELSEIKTKILNSVEVSQIFLFGSYAYGNPNVDSDFDIYVVIPDNSIRPLEAMTKINLGICEIQKRPVDVLVGTESEFNTRKFSSYIEREVFEKGVSLYVA